MGKSVSSTVDEKLWKKATGLTGAGQAETVRLALQHYVDTHIAPVGMVQAAAPPTGVKAVGDMTAEEKQASLRLLVNARQALSAAVVALTGAEAVADSDKKGLLRIKIGDVEAQLAKINARITAFQAGSLTMEPPNPATIKKISDLAEKVGKMTANAQQADLVVNAVNKVVAIWTGTQS